jgi:carbonic anhydrase
MERSEGTGHENQEGGEEGISLRKLQDEDIQSTLVLIREYVAWIGMDLSFQGIAEELETFPHAYAEPWGSFLVAIDSRKVVGCVGLRRLDRDTCELKRLFVRDSHKGRGIGQQLLTRIIEEARAKGYTKEQADLLILRSNVDFAGLCFEFKSPLGSGALSDTVQDEVERILRDGVQRLRRDHRHHRRTLGEQVDIIR